ncbi:MAG: hypothetical protein LBG15_14340 [Dysgonamonadaceae bacterium]|jgi:hypothetical protein|nr:hypothetical protein [Dysgonamonadaceae bacterium]
MKNFSHKFVELIPEHLKDDILYISIEHCIAIHKCICGCGKEVVTPISPHGWKLIFDGETVSLSPSIGNWNFECQSHYWIKNNQIVYAYKWDDKPKKKKSKKKRFFRFWKK